MTMEKRMLLVTITAPMEAKGRSFNSSSPDAIMNATVMLDRAATKMYSKTCFLVRMFRSAFEENHPIFPQTLYPKMLKKKLPTAPKRLPMLRVPKKSRMTFPIQDP